MLVKFKSETGVVDYLEPIAVTLLKAMGNSGKIPGAMRSEDVAEALSCLRAVTSREEVAKNGDDEEDYVSLHNRALPAIELMQRAVDNGEFVMWEYDS